MDGYDFIKIVMIIIVLSIPITIIYKQITNDETNTLNECEEFEVIKFNPQTMTQIVRCENGKQKEIPVTMPTLNTSR